MREVPCPRFTLLQRSLMQESVVTAVFECKDEEEEEEKGAV